MLRILDITAPDINNGNGCRVTLWVAGCTHHCKGCHNQWTWNFNQGIIFKDNKAEIYDKLNNWLSRPYIQGLTFSGGDPLCQDAIGIEEEMEIIEFVRNNYPTKDIWLYCGDYYNNLPENSIKKQLCDMCDVIVEGPYEEDKRDIAHTPFRGSTNQKITYIHGTK